MTVKTNQPITKLWQDVSLIFLGIFLVLVIVVMQILYPSAPQIGHPKSPSAIVRAEPEGWVGLAKLQVEMNRDCPVAIEIEYIRQGDGYLLNEVQWAWMRDQIKAKIDCLKY